MNVTYQIGTLHIGSLTNQSSLTIGVMQHSPGLADDDEAEWEDTDREGD
ncbi:hypothetical protein [Effusibacillus dendaii]|uniref:Uncharacterized protein n=1 Tax=Effusibacillus dendaii TaxID=2743772 RepID=A0A7I8DCG7_9BACL|nr:hypothetical protein [Effusibacillus dendaii]BCJ86659.1 hypothetical protein skT53_16440 [Effusibacillus dendaii]